MSASAVSVHAQRLPSPALRRFAWVVLAYFIAVILWGTLVRATGSGAGCGNRWPLCNGVVTPHAPAMATIIEFTHRAMSVLDLAVVALLVIWAYRAFPPRSPVRRGAALSAVFLVTEALLGAADVYKRQWKCISRPTYRQSSSKSPARVVGQPISLYRTPSPALWTNWPGLAKCWIPAMTT